MKVTIEQISEITGIREEVIKFALEMEKKLQANDSKGGWDKCEYDWLLQRVDEEITELKHSIRVDGSDRKIIRECADVANFVMMIADNTGGLG